MGILRMKLIYNQYRSSGRDVVSKKKSMFCSGGLFIQWSRAIYVILVDSISWKDCRKWKLTTVDPQGAPGDQVWDLLCVQLAIYLERGPPRCGWCPCTCTLIKNLIMIWWFKHLFLIWACGSDVVNRVFPTFSSGMEPFMQF